MKKFFLSSVMMFCAVSAYAQLCTFDRITSNSEVNIASQISLQVSSAGQVYDSGFGQMLNKARFKFINNGQVASSITEIYFYDGSLFRMYSIDDSCQGVVFENIGSATDPAALPGYNPNPQLVAVLSATEAQTPESKNGVKAGEWVEIGWTLLPGKTLQDLLNDLATREVVVGVHVKAIAQSGGGTASDSFITTPEPATMMLLGLGSMLFIRRK